MSERYILFAHPPGTGLRLLPEAPVENEEKLQEVLKANPSLIPAADLGLVSPLLVVGRETALQSGYADLVCLDPTGKLVVVEVKRGRGGDARQAIAQALDYGSDIWKLATEAARSGGTAVGVFERSVAQPYFTGSRFSGDTRPSSLAEAASVTWAWAQQDGEECGEDKVQTFLGDLEEQLLSGRYTYVVLTTELAPNVRTTLEYLSQTATFSVYGVEVDRFGEDDIDLEVYVPRAAVAPKPPPPSSPTATRARHVPAAEWLETVLDDQAREFLSALVTALGSLDVEMTFTERGSFGIWVTRDWQGRRIKKGLSDSYTGNPAGHGTGFLGPRDVLRLGYWEEEDSPFRVALDPWIDKLLAEFPGQDMRARIARYARWNLPDPDLKPERLRELIAEAVELIRAVPEDSSSRENQT